MNARLLLRVGLAVAVSAVGLGMVAASTGSSYVTPATTPAAHCGPGARPETSIQGRVPTADYTSGRVGRGYRCNAVPVAHFGSSGGFKVLRYTDRAGRVCAFYDSTSMFPLDVADNATTTGLGVYVLDMSDPVRPRQTATLTTPAMQSPHETLLVNPRRGLLGAVVGNALTNGGILDLYDVGTDCRLPKLLSSTPMGLLGHESGFAPDGRTFWSSSQYATLVAIDVTTPTLPKVLFAQGGVQYHGLRLSGDGRRLYAADLGPLDPQQGWTRSGLTILDVGQVQDRVLNPTVRKLSSITWPEHGIPQVAEPFTRGGHRYVLEVDEFVDFFTKDGFTDMQGAPVGAARIINVDNPRAPYVVSHLRLAVHQPRNRSGEQWNDPGASSFVQGYAAHYCSLPRRVNPRVAACSMIASGLRVFDLRDLRHPREAAYFNKPSAEGGYAMSQPAWDIARRSIWYSDVNSGFWNVRLTNGVGRLLAP